MLYTDSSKLSFSPCNVGVCIPSNNDGVCAFVFIISYLRIYCRYAAELMLINTRTLALHKYITVVLYIMLSTLKVYNAPTFKLSLERQDTNV